MIEKEEPTNRILVATDGSPAAEAAASIAIQVAAGQNLVVHGLYIVDEVLALDNAYADFRQELGAATAITSRTQLLGQLEAQGSVVLESLESQCGSAKVPATTEILFGGVPELVLLQAGKAQLLALGRRGHGHADDVDHLGRNFQAIARRTGRPLLVGGDEQRIVHRLLLAYNGSSRAQNALGWVSRLRATLPAEVSVLSVQETEADPASQWLEEAHARLAPDTSDICWCLQRSGTPAAEIVAAAEEIEADLIVMGRYGHSAFIEWLTGSTVEYVLRNTQRPVLMI
jgi:nucleotide-binding universal stress UspA family protein